MSRLNELNSRIFKLQRELHEAQQEKYKIEVSNLTCSYCHQKIDDNPCPHNPFSDYHVTYLPPILP